MNTNEMAETIEQAETVVAETKPEVKPIKKAKPVTTIYKLSEMNDADKALRSTLFRDYQAFVASLTLDAVSKEAPDKPIVSLTKSAYGYGVKIATRWANFDTINGKGEHASMLCELSGGHLRPIRPLGDVDASSKAKQLRQDAINELLMLDYMAVAQKDANMAKWMAKNPYAAWAKQARTNMTTTQIVIEGKDGSKRDKFTAEQLAANKVRADAFELRVNAKVAELMTEGTEDSE